MKPITRSIYLHSVLFLSALILLGSIPVVVEAKSTSWFLGPPAGSGQDFIRKYLVVSDDSTYNPSTGSYINNSLALQSLEVKYHVRIERKDTGEVIRDGASVPVGTQIVLKFVPREEEDITWIGRVDKSTGNHTDTPYGVWKNDPNGPSSYPPKRCWLGDNYLGQGRVHNRSVKYYGDYYVQPPDKSITSLDGLDCGALSNGGVMNCTVTRAKTYTPQFNFTSTASKFWGQRNVSLSPGECVTESEDFKVAARSISYTIKGTEPENRPPTAPVITGPTEGIKDTKYSFSFRSTDPDSDKIRYGLDWDSDEVVDAWLPGSGHVASGVSRDWSRSWPSKGTKRFKAFAQDEKGAKSGWSTHTIVLENPPVVPKPTVILTAKPGTIDAGESSNLEWSSTNATSCTGTGFNTGGRTLGKKAQGTHVAVTPPQTKTYTITCTGPGGSADDSATVTVRPGGGNEDGGDSCPPGQIFVEGTNECKTGECPLGYQRVTVNGVQVCRFIACPAGYVRDPVTLLCKRRECTDALFCQGNNLYRRDPITCRASLVQACAPGVCTANACVDAPAPEVILWEVTPTIGVKGYEATIRWDVVNVSSCSVTGTDGSSWTGFVSGVMGPNGRAGKVDIVEEETTYTLSCVGAGGEATRETTVRLVPVHNED